MHTIDATETINRLLDLFPSQQQRGGAHLVRRRAARGSSRSGSFLARTTWGVPAVEVLIATGRVYDRILDPEATIEIRDLIAEGGYYGMQTFDQALVTLVHDGLVTEDEAKLASTNPHDFVLALRASLSRGAVGIAGSAQSGSPAALRAARSIGWRRYPYGIASARYTGMKNGPHREY